MQKPYRKVRLFLFKVIMAKDRSIFIGLYLQDSPDGMLQSPGLHITLAYLPTEIGVNKDRLIEDVRVFAQNYQPISGKINATTVFENGDERAFVGLFDSNQLPHWRQKLLDYTRLYDFVDINHGYIPHITIKYLEPGESEPDMSNILNQELWFDKISVVFNATGETHEFELTGDRYRQKEGVLMNSIAELWERIKRAFEPFLEERRIKTVESWDGSPTNYSDTEAYCSACLIDVNGAAGREEKAQSHCMLPVREDGDSRGAYVDRAVFAAAGGRGISGVEKPEDVPQEAWDSAMQAAANQIIGAYEEMDRIAPGNVYEIAGKEKPRCFMGLDKAINTGRAIDLPEFYNQVLKYIGENYDERAIMTGLYHDTDDMYTIVAYDGKLWRIDLSVNDMDEVQFSEPSQVKMEFSPVGRMMVKRGDDGQHRWIATCCTAILNRVGEIDTMALFDDFIARIENGEASYPQLDFYHLPGSDFGQCDYLARDGYVLIASGTFDNTPIGTRAAETLSSDNGYWGNSIAYFPLDYGVMDVSGVQIRAFDSGVLHKITVLPENEAASLFTAMRGGVIVKDKIKEAAQRLVGEELADELEQQVDGVNRMVAEDGLIARESTEDKPVEVTPISGVAQTNEASSEVEVITKVRESITSNEQAISGVNQTMSELVKLIEDLSGRIEALEISDEQRKRAWLSEATISNSYVSHRPRVARKDNDAEDEPSTDEKVKNLLANKGLRA